MPNSKNDVSVECLEVQEAVKAILSICTVCLFMQATGRLTGTFKFSTRLEESVKLLLSSDGLN
jgi:hypothetical protein